MNIRIERIMEFNPSLIRELFSSVGETNITPNRVFFESEKNILLTAYSGTHICGFLYAYLLDNIKSENTKIFLYSIDVFETYRQKGAGRQLIESLKQIARKNSCTEIFVITNNRNIAAMGLYEKTGGSYKNTDDVVFVYV